MGDMAPDTRLRDHFIGWQCRVRQHAMREYGGRPSPGMRPRVLTPDGAEVAAAITVVLIEAEPAAATAQFHHVVQKTHDPEKRHGDGVKLLSASYFQTSRRFSGVVTALFALDSTTARSLAEAGCCLLEFEQFSQSYRLHCAVADLAADDAAYQATFWHNSMFNPSMPGRVRILAFTPDWSQSTAYPPA